MTPGIPDGPATMIPAGTATDEIGLVESLRQGDERAFSTLVERYHSLLIRLALAYVHEPAIAEEVAQETWLEVVRGVHRFEGRSTLKTWLCAILVNRARTRATREDRSLPFSALEQSSVPDDFTAPAAWFDEAGWWASSAVAPRPWPASPEEQVLSGETRACIVAAIATLPPAQRQVITLRDMQGWSAAEACNVLGLSETNQRVLLHRARYRVRLLLEAYFKEGSVPTGGVRLP